ncbi:MAG: hypothetical protein HRT65_01790 [Flavobacteriaceae bacterium]|nr:hypothetical protein [Flavobacteriaceae bacterium]
MIKFFRRIRQQLLADNKLGKYVLYAIGEIVLVVIGILIALQLNRMREEQQDRAKELSYLKEINLDFKYNKQQLDSILDFNAGSLKAGLKLDSLMTIMKRDVAVKDHPNYPMNDSMFSYQSRLFTNLSFNPKNGSVRALINSSSFDLIQNDSLRRMLISWNDVLGDYLEEEGFNMKFLFDEYYPWQRDVYEFEKPYSAENMAVWLGPKEYNFRWHRIGSLDYLLQVVEDEGVVQMIDGIIRLTEKEMDDDHNL